MFERVLILSVDIGSGHVRAAQALQKVFARLEAAREVRIADAMQYTSKLFWRLFERAHPPSAPDVPRPPVSMRRIVVDRRVMNRYPEKGTDLGS